MNSSQYKVCFEYPFVHYKESERGEKIGWEDATGQKSNLATGTELGLQLASEQGVGKGMDLGFGLA